MCFDFFSLFLQYLSSFEFIENVDFSGIMRNCILPLARHILDDDWMHAFIDKEATLAILPHLRATCVEWHNTIYVLTEYVALRIAQIDFRQAKPWGISPLGSQFKKKEMTFFISKYKVVLFFLPCSWRLKVDVCKWLLTTPLAKLFILELQDLHFKLHDEDQAYCKGKL